MPPCRLQSSSADIVYPFILKSNPCFSWPLRTYSAEFRILEMLLNDNFRLLNESPFTPYPNSSSDCPCPFLKTSTLALAAAHLSQFFQPSPFLMTTKNRRWLRTRYQVIGIISQRTSLKFRAFMDMIHDPNDA